MSRPIFLELEVIPNAGPSPTDRLVVMPPGRMLIPLFTSPIAWINADDSGRAQVQLTNGLSLQSTEKFFNLRGRLIKGAEIVQKDLMSRTES